MADKIQKILEGSPAPIEIKRKIELRWPNQRLKSDEKVMIKNEFNRLADNGLINKYIFRMEIMGAQVPDVISERIFCMFASKKTQGQMLNIPLPMSQNEQATTIGNPQSPSMPTNDGMDLEDLTICYLIFNQRRPDEIAQLCFEIMKLTKDQEALSIDDMQHFCVMLLQKNKSLVTQFYKKTQLDPRITMTKKEFMQVFPLVQDLSIFTFTADVVGGFKKNHLNINKDLYGKNNLSGLSEIQMEYQIEKASHMGLSKSEMETVGQFYDEEIRGQDAAIVLKAYQSLLKDMTNKTLYGIMISRITTSKGNDFEFFHQLISQTVKNSKGEQRLEFIFDIFSNFQEEMKLEDIQRFCEIFNMPSSEEQKMDKEQFVELYYETHNFSTSHASLFTESKYTMMGMLGLSCEGTLDEQRKSIKSVMGQTQDLKSNIDLERYINDNLINDPSFYIIEKEFWKSWSEILDKFQENTEQKKEINNLKLIMKGHQQRKKEELIYGEDFVIVPKYVYKSLSKWYPCNKQMVLHVIKTENNQTIKHLPKMSRLDTTGDVQAPRTPEINIKKSNFSTNVQAHQNEEIESSPVAPLDDQIQIDKPFPNENGNYDTNIPTPAGSDFKIIHQNYKYELEMYPITIYFALITSEGKKNHFDCVQDNKINWGYMQKTLKTDMIPFKEFVTSKHSTFEFVLKHFTEVFEKPNPKKGRLLFGDQILSGLKLQSTITELGLRSGQLIYVEYLEPNNTWPTDKQRSEKETSKQKQDKESFGETVGLYNLGNTCYMNSALQCLVNIKLLHEYYVKYQLYTRQLNIENKLGHKGELVMAFAGLMQQIWNSQQVVVPKGFKYTLGKINEQFSGDDQQDSQEYVNFLIDGLHEETNLRKDKPFIENPSSKGRDLTELALEQWSNNLRRDWSFIFFMFYGQMKSTTECLTCHNKSTMYDIFANIPVSLPEPSELFLNIIVHRIPNKVKYIIHPKIAIKGNIIDIENEQLKQNYTKLTNDQPIHVCIKITKNIKISDLIQKIIEIKEVNIDPTHMHAQNFSELILYSKSVGTVRGVFEPSNRLTQYKLITNEIHAQEVLTHRGKDYIKLIYQHNPAIRLVTSGILESLSYEDSDNLQYLDDKKEKQQRQQLKRNQHEIFGKSYIFNNYLAACDKYNQLYNLQRLPEEIITIAYHRRFVRKEGSFFHDVQPQLLSSPIILSLPLQPTGKRIYEEVWSMAHRILKKNSRFFESDNLWWNYKNWKKVLDDSKDSLTRSETLPFVLKMVDRQGYSCSQCNWTEKCSGCIIEPNESVCIYDWLKKCHIAIEWHSQMIEEDYNPTSNEIMRHSSINMMDNEIEEQVVSLDKCLQKFHDTEKLSDQVYCSQCKEHTNQSKSSEIFRPPPILTIQLKRFKRIGQAWRKLQTLVEFPLNNLDLSNFVQDHQFLKSNDISAQYDLCGVINHYGSLTYGHYISNVKNPYNNRWYKYDDHFRHEINESQISKESAYILFYIRKDVHKKQLNDILPQTNQIFPGLPLRTQYGDGFILGPKRPEAGTKEIITYYVKIPTRDEIHEFQVLDIKKMLNRDSDIYDKNAHAQIMVDQNSQKKQKKITETVFTKMRKSIRLTMGINDQNLNGNQINDLHVEKQKLIAKENQIMGQNYQTNESSQNLMNQQRIQVNVDGQSEKTNLSGSNRGGKKKKKKRQKQALVIIEQSNEVELPDIRKS